MERKRFIERLQQFARDRSIRVSFIGGDVNMRHSKLSIAMKNDQLSRRFTAVAQDDSIPKT